MGIEELQDVVLAQSREIARLTAEIRSLHALLARVAVTPGRPADFERRHTACEVIR
jgi:hypothetical protein